MMFILTVQNYAISISIYNIRRIKCCFFKTFFIIYFCSKKNYLQWIPFCWNHENNWCTFTPLDPSKYWSRRFQNTDARRRAFSLHGRSESKKILAGRLIMKHKRVLLIS